MAERTCSVDGCGRSAESRGWCKKHYDRWRAHGDPLTKHKPGRPRSNTQCTVEGCEKRAKCTGLCPAHYARKRNGIPFDRPLRRWQPGSICEVPGCDKPHVAGGLCAMHWQRQRKTGQLGQAHPTKAPAGTGYVNPDGYRMLSRGGRGRTNIGEHRYVMEQILGRPLHPFETPHHKNGIRHDNRPENLELWTKPQPAGQRPEDLAAWVVEFYPDLVAAELRARLG